MRRLLLVLLALSGAALPAAGTSSCETACAIAVAFEAGGWVCTNGTPNPAEVCTYPIDGPEVSEQDVPQGLYLPILGPPATGPFAFASGVGAAVPCVDATGSACRLSIGGTVGPETGLAGAYCGPATWRGTMIFVASSGQRIEADIWWGSAGVLAGSVTGSEPAGYEGRPVAGRVSVRVAPGGGNCGITNPATHLQMQGAFTIA